MAKIQDGNVYIIMNVASGTVVDLNNGSSASGPPAYIQGFPILLNNPGNLQHQLWDAKLEVSDSSGDWYSFRNHTTQTAIDCGNMSNEGKQLVCYEYHPKFSNQLWQLTPIPNNPIPFYQYVRTDIQRSLSSADYFQKDLQQNCCGPKAGGGLRHGRWQQ